MNSNRKIAITAGALYIIGTIAGLLSIVPAIDAADYMIQASANANQVLFGALFQFIMTIAYLGFAITLFPLLRKYKEGLALGFLCFRIIAAVLNIIGFISLLMLLSLSQEFVKIGAPSASYFITLGDLLRSGRDFVNHIAMILSISIGSLMFYFLLFQTKLVPRWLSLWGLVGTIFTISASFLVMFHVIDIITTIYIGLNFPLIILEMILAIWFIAKGFDSNVINSIADKE
jgi:hypothetical protein